MKIAILSVAALTAAFAQTSPSFEVTSIRPSHSGQMPAGVFFEAGRFRAENASIRTVIGYAYHVKDFRISGGPTWLDSERYDINAKEEDAVAESMQGLPWKQYRAELELMVQSLLTERFKLRVLHRPRELPIYAFVTSKTGPKLSRSNVETYSADVRGHRGEFIAKGLSLAQLADILSWMSEVDERKVVDRTGIEGLFDLTLRWAPPAGPRTAGSPATGTAEAPNASDEPSIFTALQEQLGLKLQPTKGTVDFLVIEYIEKPSQN